MNITLFSLGDANSISYWSNIPYLLTASLRERGAELHHVNIGPSRLLRLLWTCSVGIWVRATAPGTSSTYFRSSLNEWHTRWRIKRAERRHADSDLLIFLTFSFSASKQTLIKKPVVQLCDWSYDHDIKVQRGKAPDRFERRALLRERAAMQASTAVVSLFPAAAQAIRSQLGPGHAVHYFGHVTNSLCDPLSPEQALAQKRSACKLLFIGDKKYLASAQQLIRLIPALREQHPGLELDIIGISRNQLMQPIPPGVQVHGYLNKAADNQRVLFYRLIQQARFFINSSPNWGGFSALLEAMVHHTPFVMVPNPGYLAFFGPEPDCGFYLDDASDAAVSRGIDNALRLDPERYAALLKRSHAIASQHSWANFADKLLASVGLNSRS